MAQRAASAGAQGRPRPSSIDIEPGIYQSGYLTIRDDEPEVGLYTLGYPNEEVRGGFLHFLLPSDTGIGEGNGGMHIVAFTQELRRGDVDALLERLRGFFAGIPYDLNEQAERHYQVVFYLVFALMGQLLQTEVKSAQGRVDAVVWTRERVSVFEFKLRGTAEEALVQIETQGYAKPYAADGREVVRVGESLMVPRQTARPSRSPRERR